MTEEQKEILIAKMLDAPSSLSDEELDAIVRDEELREIYDISSAVSGACIRYPEMDATKEWERFLPRIRRRPFTMWRIMRVAAIFLGVVFVFGIAVKTVDDPGLHDDTIVVAKIEPSVAPEIEPSIAPEAEPSMPPEQPVALDTKPISAPSPAKAEAAVQNTTVESNDIDIDEYLRVQKAKVDNDLAMQAAEIYEAQRVVMVKMLDLIDGENEVSNVKKVIML